MAKNGRWFVNDRIFNSKSAAVEYASRTNSQIYFDFFNKFYENLNWQIEPQESLQELYRQRAEQLLDTYDYVVLLLSGGSDSTNMVRTFINNNLRPAEVVSHGILNQLVKPDSKTNIEITLSASKTAKLCEQACIPYRFINLWDIIKDVKYTDDFFETADTRMCIDNLFRIEGLHGDKKFLEQVKKGKKVCLVHGLEKPRVFIKDGWFMTSYLDSIIMQNNWGRDTRDNRGVYLERFYTSTDMPTINIKQCHVIINYFEQNVKNYKDVLVHTDKFDYREYYKICNDILYPDTWRSQDYFTLGKTKSEIDCQKYQFIAQMMPDSQIFKDYQGVLDNFYRSIDPKYRQESGDITGNYSGFYKLKKIATN